MTLPFPGGIESSANGTLILALLAAVSYLMARGQLVSWRRSVVKTAAVALLAVLSLIQSGPILLTAGLALGALGDFFLSRDGDRRFFLAGLAAFLAAHLAYVVLFASRGQGLDLVLAETWRLGAAILIVSFAVAMLARLWPAVDDALRGPVAAYVAAIVAMGLAAATVPGWIILAGAVLFILSDAVLAAERFLLAPDAPARIATGPLIWITYFTAQLAIALGLLL